MEGKTEPKIYTIYRITSPGGGTYVGYTSMTLKNRWGHHRRRAMSGECIGHPFYDDIRRYEAKGYKLETLRITDDRIGAMDLEQMYIAAEPKELSMNISSGGLNDAREGGRIFWDRINADPKKREKYLKKLSDVKKANDWTDYEKLMETKNEWMREHPREAYRNAYRAIRIANKVNGYPPPCHRKTDDRPLKERLMHKYKLNELKSRYVTKVWAQRTEEERKSISEKISKAQSDYMAGLSLLERRNATEKARESIDKSKQGKAASRGLKKWWAELKQDPERYAEYMAEREASRRRTLDERRQHEDI